MTFIYKRNNITIQLYKNICLFTKSTLQSANYNPRTRPPHAHSVFIPGQFDALFSGCPCKNKTTNASQLLLEYNIFVD